MICWAGSPLSLKDGMVSRERRNCQAGQIAMINLAAEAVRTHNFDGKSLQLTLAEIACRS